ncbi:mannitol dehydrogenase family protein [Oharaeibacter diazotrophicus]|uniref:Mannitol 2-dehydrogenase n=1 Tax=Oharaeibacter diazotrophicus TaxID=1920512 RepID=A0A4V6PVG5_9HYPH|nr:mannitol dehydrogenase family protein [Oharaeibacter diazotrophicus]TDP85038.1 mannitol 2-dehydrogenase [Oharaeibacter diazotrophicus]BBE74008.1 mannitol 2-dehydrogenase [Pleomorphomonas sp. SM30]GLS76304.1 mannitol 2-dehydrogenase [Oharaeibacter diazotrophicus]
MTTKLSLANLPAIGARARVPTYARADLSPGIVHFGVGNFHRAHMAVYLDELFEAGRDRDFAIVGAGVLPSDHALRDKLAGQDFLSTVVEQSAEVSAARVTGAMVGYETPGDVAAIVARLADPATRIVSTTITEGGYFIDPATGRFDPTHPDIVHDAAHPDAPRTVFGLILAGLRARRAAGLAPFTVMCCDNIPHNGKVTLSTLTGLATLSDPAFADWVATEVACPNAMVDRITPATGKREIDLTAELFGIDDAWPVFCEDFRQWVVEDRFPLGRPAFETVGVQFVDDVSPFELMKIRILNGGHAAIAYPAALMDIHFVHEAMEHPLVAGFLAKLEREEIVPTVPPVPDTDLSDYLGLIERRFANPKIGDTIRRLCLDGSNRQPKFILPTIADRLAAGAPLKGLPMVSALWCRYCAGTTDSGAVTAPNDPAWDRLQAAALAARDDPAAFLAMRDIFGAVADAPAFRDRFAATLAALWRDGTAETLRRYLDGSF